MMWGYFGGPWGWVGPIGMFLFWLAVLVAVAYLLRLWWASPPGRARDDGDALTLLERRYAKGELTRDEFLKMRADLTERPR
ncbi:MAG: SHOCT domain-containing protein [Firmicutes bacterium]|nr:SHOCT domain-containing protein [Bacillota bacterium]